MDKNCRNRNVIDDQIRMLISDVEKFAQSKGINIDFKYPFRIAPELEVTGLSANATGLGHGTEVMNYLIDRADEIDVNVILRPSSSRNKVFYNRFGFVDSERYPSFMIRYSETNDTDDD